jgi:4-coumarate--CoA ligase
VSTIDRWACGAAPLGNDLIDLVEKRTKIPVRGGYGMTETTCLIAVASIDVRKQGSVGNLLPNMLGKLVDDELFVKGPNIMKGYLHNPKADSEAFTDDGWLKTGDVCRFDEDGTMFIVDRVKEVRWSSIYRCTIVILMQLHSAHQIQGISGGLLTAQLLRRTN